MEMIKAGGSGVVTHWSGKLVIDGENLNVIMDCPTDSQSRNVLIKFNSNDNRVTLISESAAVEYEKE